MASSQQAHGANQFSDKEKAAIDEALKEAQSVLENNIKNAKTSQNKVIWVTGVMHNIQPRPLKLERVHEWKGKFLAAPSDKIGESGAFVQEGQTVGINPGALGSKGFVIYGTYDKALPQLGWLLAWDKSYTLNTELDKVYVEAGNLTKLLNMKDSEIEEKLDGSSNISRYWDSETSAAAAAQMTNHADNLALVGAAFDVIRVPIPPQ